jgi:tetratricopeptide (TPR) repeat protein
MKKNLSSLLILALCIFPLPAAHAGAAQAALPALRPVAAGQEHHCAIAESYVKMGDYASARAVLRLALESDPSGPSYTCAALRLASLHEETGNPLMALSILKQAALKKDPESEREGDGARREILMEMGRIYCAMGQDWPALDCYLRAAELGESRAATAMLRVGKRLFRQGDVGRARDVFALIRTAFPKDRNVVRALADLDS